MKIIQSIDRTMNILTVLDTIGGSDGLGVKQLAELVKLKVPTCHNILQTLIQLGFIEQTESLKYRISDKTRYLGWDGQKKEHLVEIVRPELRLLAGETNETCILAVRSGNQWQTLLKIESRQMLTVRHNLPMTDNFYISATGRCILAQLREQELSSFLRTHPLPSNEEWEGADSFPRLQEKLAGIRENGFEIYPAKRYGVTGAAVPLRRNPNCSDGALGVIIPDFRFCGNYKESLMAKMRQTAESVNREIALL
jgi:DNA-binding IclR family transcriptional regulator